jgi:hypothetical protein
MPVGHPPDGQQNYLQRLNFSKKPVDTLKCEVKLAGFVRLIIYV